MKFKLMVITLFFTVQDCFAPSTYQTYQTMPTNENGLVTPETIFSDKNRDYRRQRRRTTKARQKLKKYTSLEEGPKRNDSYDPTFGYEPYWKYGQWVMDPDKDLNGSSTKGPNCPYITCPPPFTQFGKLCARDKRHNSKTFGNYCDMLDEDCEGHDDWLIVYRGPCQNTTTLLLWTLKDMKSRATSYIMWWWNNSPSTKFVRKNTTPTPKPDNPRLVMLQAMAKQASKHNKS